MPQLVVETDYELVGIHQGSVQVESGHLDLQGTNQGSLSLHPGSTATISGTQQGSVFVAAGVSVRITGAIEGSTNVSHGARVIVEPTGKLAGSLHNEGVVVVRGVFGGTRSGNGELVLEDQGYEKRPTIRDGVHVYEW